ncbi:DUF2163 domain-containing protein [Methylobacterium indicum]|uniref:Beta tubulin, autoregulation binding site n=1 Tax=Methylobacterium indicum TaxID=1775910 RepID=A0ABR5GTB5_9HYPH|nr:DUF2163 domain-containing protein [Methylobacterium indicum]KMO12609.1 beta tubulin, autoregulation binding site [Methylobacterium indicum]KMO23759.1 beta tubulin, autoregulation binding site [Methylobacterium indicum]
MKILSPSLAAHLASGVTTLCHCWIVTRTDGLRLGFTDHDEDLVVDGVTCSAESGATGTAVEQGTGLAADSLEIVGALTSGRLAESELARGLFDGAAVAVWRVDWASPADRVLILSGTVGEVSRGPTAFTAEVRGLADRLNQPRGRVYQRSCDALLGDARCGIDAGAAAIRGAGTVATVRSARSVTASGLSAYVSRWFEAGRLVWTSGANAGAAVEVRAHGLAGGLASLDLWEPMPAPINPGDTFQVVAGCDKSLASCRDKFANVLNFRGFPDLPGNDYAVAYAVQGADNDGGRLG